MRTIPIKYLAAGVVLSAAMVYLAAAGIKAGSVYSVPVERYLNDTSLQTQRVRLHGKVSADDFASNPGKLSAQFVLLGKTPESTVHIAYTGVIPDLFKAGCDVVVEGRRDERGVFQSDLLMTKCASKYEPGSPHSAVTEQKS